MKLTEHCLKNNVLCSYEVAEPYFTIALPSIRHENELLIRRENELHQTRDCTMRDKILVIHKKINEIFIEMCRGSALDQNEN